jgi:hypothetical protein
LPTSFEVPLSLVNSCSLHGRQVIEVRCKPRSIKKM